MFATKKLVKKMTSKAGRPIVGKPKINDIKVRLGDAMHKNLLEYCVEHDTIKVEAIRQVIQLLLNQ